VDILVYKGTCPYELLTFIAEEMAGAFRSLGHNAVVIDLAREDSARQIEETLYKYNGCDFVFAFNAIGIHLKSGRHSLYDALNTPFVSIMVDHPCHHIGRLDSQLKHLLLTCTDKSHLDFLAEYYPSEHIKIKSFLSTAGTELKPFQAESFEEYQKQRTTPVLFAGNFEAPERTWLSMSLDDELIKLLNDTADYMLSDANIALDKACGHVMKHTGLELNFEHKKKVYSMLLPLVYKYVWSYCRHRLLKVLAQAQIPMVVCNRNPEGYFDQKKYKSITFIGKKTYRELLTEICRAKFFLDTNTNLLYGTTERVFNAMLNGAVAISQANYSEEFRDGEDLVFYKWPDFDGLPARIFALLENPAATYAIAQNAAAKAKTKHTWLQRAQKILNIVTMYQNLNRLYLERETH
jgi:glycosyltransferase involved in cell wall biosynthesis